MPDVAELGVVITAPAGLLETCVQVAPVMAVAAKVAVVIGVVPTHVGDWSVPAFGFVQAQFGIVIFIVSEQVAPVAQMNW